MVGSVNFLQLKKLLVKLRPMAFRKWVGLAQSVKRFATSLTVRGSNPGGEDISARVLIEPEIHPASVQWVQILFPGCKADGEWR
jgi:hypothetical protein